jgi:hypothetical protein
MYRICIFLTITAEIVWNFVNISTRKEEQQQLDVLAVYVATVHVAICNMLKGEMEERERGKCKK